MITGLTPIPATGASQTPASAQQSLGKDDFLQLLVAQLSAQDPLNPLDSQDFSAQLAQFSSLEQITNVNNTLKEIKVSQEAMTSTSLINLIGKEVDVAGDTFDHLNGKTPRLSYTLPEPADSVLVDIFDATGGLVTTLNGNGEPGTNLVTWNGLNGQGGAAPEGAYTFAVRAVDVSGQEIEAATFTTGVVTDVLFEEGAVYAVVQGQKIEAGHISRVSSL
ncbi:MAG: flagellar hook assembly protein FlgD [Nitrospinaceae bacterium]